MLARWRVAGSALTGAADGVTDTGAGDGGVVVVVVVVVVAVVVAATCQHANTATTVDAKARASDHDAEPEAKHVANEQADENPEAGREPRVPHRWTEKPD